MALASPPGFARRHVDQHQVHGPAAKPVLGLRRRPARQRNFMTIEAAHPRPMHRNLAAVEADLALRRAPAGDWRGRTGLGRLKFSPQSRSKEAAQPSVTTRRAPNSGPATPIPLALIQGLRSVNAFAGYCHRVPGAKTPKLCWRSHPARPQKKQARTWTIGEWRQL